MSVDANQPLKADAALTSNGLDDNSDHFKLGHLLAGLAVSGAGAGWRLATWIIRAFWYISLAIFSLPVLVNLRSLWRYQQTGKLVIRSYDPFMYCWLAITAAPLLTFAQWLGAEPLFLGYVYLTIVSYAFYTIGRDVTWRRGWVVFALALALIAVVWALGERLEYAFFKKLKEALAETNMTFPATWANALSFVLGILYFQMLVERHVSGTLTFEGDKLVVRELGESASDHERSAYSIISRTDDVNEFLLGFSRTLILRPRSSRDPEYVFRHVPGLPYLMPTVLKLSIPPVAAAVHDEFADRLAAGDGHAEGDAAHHG